MSKKIFLLFVVFYTSFLEAQNAQQLIDDLKQELKNKPDAKRTATIFSDLTWYYSNVSLDSAMVYGKKAIVESVKLKDSVLIAQVYSDLGAVYFRKGEIASSKQSYLNAYSIRKRRNDYAGMAKVNANLANIYNKEGQKKLALKSYLETIDYFEKTNKLDFVATTKANIGLLFNDMKNYPKAMKYTKEAIDYQEKNNIESGLCTSYLTLGNVYLRLKDTVNAVLYYNKSLKSSRKVGNNIALSSALNNIGSIKSQQKKSKEANVYFDKSKTIRDSLNIVKDESSLSLSLAKEAIMYSRFKEAKILLLKLKKQYETTPNNKENLFLTYKFLIHTYAYLNLPDSVNFYNNESSKLQDQLIETTVLKQTNELETKYQTAKKEKLLLQKEIEAKKKNATILILSLLAVFVGLIGFLIYRQQKLKNKQQEQEFELKSAIAQIETQNKLHEQRLSISRDLHDNIGAQLTFVISSIDNLKYGNQITESRINNQLTKISDFTKSTIIELRDTIWAMNTSEFTIEDLHSRILNFIEKAKSAKAEINFKFQIDPEMRDVKFSSVIGINLYRTIQEAVNNAIKYSEANNITVEVKSVGDQIEIVIQDNGKGFDLDVVDFGNGLHNMKKRIEEVKGTCNIQSKPNDGTTISLLLPKNQPS